MHMRASAKHRLAAMDACVRWGGRFCVAFVWAFCAVGYWSVWHYVFIPYMMYTAHDPFHIFILLVFHALVILCLYSYYCAIRTDPGFVLPGYLPPEMEEGRLHSVAERDDEQAASGDEQSDDGGARGDGDVEMKLLRGSGGARGPSKGKERIRDRDDDGSASDSDADSSSSDSDSEGEKEEGSDPDQKQKKPKNRKKDIEYFFLFLFYGAGVGAMFLTLFSFCIYDLFKHSDKYTSEQLWINGVTVGMIVWVAAAFTINLTAMGFHTLNLIITNATTIEKMALRARLWRRGRPSNGKKLRHKYDLGPQANLRQVMGSSPLQWFFPTPPETDGYYSLTYPNLNNQFELW
ncbi:uncharacterized protein ACA1_163490 [Acanthamoeba castellanii str. Neff]|uniref:Protein S-acyltransferase n=1 Tax=Acanthamoeba castellanii (strain ATCC 30010 / Neff) TaxID=1257118 RepID=L8GTS7_ACACF|nr:uncharacterized protein ACA1_163490 [Acanthamoeba castellanii str. Neff]ELR15521.1 hypothetical protein ACA1_163490 [Acanthamoeba castellanii str. Neff]